MSESTPSIELDDTDTLILAELSAEGRLSYRELGERVGLSPNATAARVNRLLDEAVITGFHAAVDQAAIGRPLEALIDCRLTGYDVLPAFLEFLAGDSRVLRAVHVTGRFDYMLQVAVASTMHLQDLLFALSVDPGFTAETETRLILQQLTPG